MANHAIGAPCASPTYLDFLARKKLADTPTGFQIDESELHPALKDFQRAVVRWGLGRGRALFGLDTGLGKTISQGEWARQVHRHTHGDILLLAPLCVAHQTVAELAKWGIDSRYARKQAQAVAGITVANYEMIEHFDMARFAGVVLDESSILKHQDSKTRALLTESCRSVPFRLSCSATPAPNDYMELGQQAEFLGIMSCVEMLATFFTHDGGETSKWRLKGHGRSRFWEWLATWAVCIRRPSDMGFSDDGYDLPPLNIHHHVIETAAPDGELFAKPAQGLMDRRRAQRESLEHRVAACAARVNASADQWVIWCHLNDESTALAQAIPDALDLKGSDSIDRKEQLIDDFTAGRLRVLVTKPSIAGFGMNWQHCHETAFVGLSDSFESFYQAIRRFYRFGQTHPVNAHLYSADSEGAVKENIERKQAQADAMAIEMVQHMREFTQRELFAASAEKAEYDRKVATGDGWELHLGDCVDVAAGLPDGSVGYSIFSPPFASLYTYSNSDRDMGNCRTDAEFFEHFEYLIPQLFRITQPGRLVSFHCMNLPSSKVRDGFIGIRDFRGELIRRFEAHGWIFHSEVCIWKDPVTAMQRTKALGLLYKQLKKDSAMSRQGIPDYLVTMRKPGENESPISHDPEEFPCDMWQRYASPVWMDINPTRTLQYMTARDNDDERHICPLQLDVIERGIELWSAPGDLVFSPFTGIGSEGYCARKMGRKFIGAELKQSYFDLAARNLHDATRGNMDLFSLGEEMAA